jgi:hypothetical protein
LASTFRHETVLEEAAFTLGAEGFEDRIDCEKRLFACFDRAAEVSPHLNKRKTLVVRPTRSQASGAIGQDGRSPLAAVVSSFRQRQTHGRYSFMDVRLSRQVNLKEACRSGSLHCPAASTIVPVSRTLVSGCNLHDPIEH